MFDDLHLLLCFLIERQQIVNFLNYFHKIKDCDIEINTFKICEFQVLSHEIFVRNIKVLINTHCSKVMFSKKEVKLQIHDHKVKNDGTRKGLSQGILV